MGTNHHSSLYFSKKTGELAHKLTSLGVSWEKANAAGLK